MTHPELDVGVDGYGYRRADGKLVKPLVDLNRMRIASGPGNSAVFRDPFGNDVYYYCESQDWYRYRTGVVADPPSTPPFDGSHNTGGPADINRYVGNMTGASPPFLAMDILLCTKGPDVIWGSKDPKDGTVRENYCDFRDIDDLTNFLGD